MSLSRAAEDRPTPREVYNYRVYMLAISACLGSWLFGYNNGVIAGVIVLPSFFHDFHLPPDGTQAYNNAAANIVSMLQIGGLCGSLATFPAMKLWGRRFTLEIAGAVNLVGAILQTFSYGRLSMMYAGRLISGLGVGAVTVVVPLYIAEISPPAIRGSLVGIYEINNQLSSFMGYWCNYLVNEYIPGSKTQQWQIPLAMQMIPSALLCVVSIFILPESPRFLVSQGNVAKAREVLAFVRHLPPSHLYINQEIEEIEEAAKRRDNGRLSHRTSKLGLFGELWWKGNRNRVCIGLGLMLGQNLTGINGMNFYAPSVFKSIGFDGTKVGLLASGMFAVVKTITTILAIIFFIDRVGRRKLLLTSSVGTSLALWYIGGFVTASHIDLSKPHAKSISGWIAIVCVYVYAAFFSMAWSGVVWVYCAEIFPTRIKELSVCLTTALQWITQFAIARAAPYMLSNMRGGFFFFFAACIVVSGVLVYFLVPETKGQTLERMDEIFGTPYSDVELGHVERNTSSLGKDQARTEITGEIGAHPVLAAGEEVLGMGQRQSSMNQGEGKEISV